MFNLRGFIAFCLEFLNLLCMNFFFTFSHIAIFKDMFCLSGFVVHLLQGFTIWNISYKLYQKR